MKEETFLILSRENDNLPCYLNKEIANNNIFYTLFDHFDEFHVITKNNVMVISLFSPEMIDRLRDAISGKQMKLFLEISQDIVGNVMEEINGYMIIEGIISRYVLNEQYNEANIPKKIEERINQLLFSHSINKYKIYQQFFDYYINTNL